MDKLTIATQVLLKLIETDKTGFDAEGIAGYAWEITDAMQAEADKRKPSGLPDALKEKWQPDWSKAPEGYDYFCVGGCSGVGYFCNIKPVIYKDHYWFTGEDVIEVKDHGYQGNWKDSLRKRPETKCELDWRIAPQDTTGWKMKEDKAYWIDSDGWIIEDAPSFGFTGSHIMERPNGF